MLLSQGWRASIVAFGLVLTLAPGTALAWQTVKSGAGGTKVLATPTPDGTLSGQVDPGKPLTVGDKPTSGFYRCNAGKGLNGWCEETELDFGAKGAPKAANNSTGQPGADAVRNSKWHKGSGALETNMYVGLLVGLGFYSGSTRLGFGVDGGYKLGPDWALGLYVTYASTGSDAAGISVSGSSIIIAPEVNYWLPGELKGMHLGGKIGLNLSSASSSSSGAVLPAGTSGSSSSTDIVFGVAGGYDYPISQDITIGGEANFLIVSSSGSSSSSSTTTTSSGSSSVFNLLVSAKYWL